MFCKKYPVQSCDNCGSTCYNTYDPDAECDCWIPDRGGHPSTPNPCECSSYQEYNLCLGECEGCKFIEW